MLLHMPATKSRTVSLFKNGKSQALRIPKEFELDAKEAKITRAKNGTLTITPIEKEKTFAEFLIEWAKEDLTEEERTMPEIEDLPLKPIDPFGD